MRALTSKRTALEPVVTRWDAWCAMERESRELESIAAGTDAELAAMARGELPELRARAVTVMADLVRRLVTSDDERIGAVILEIRAGVGGDEAALWAGDLLEMYRRAAARRRQHQTKPWSRPPSSPLVIASRPARTCDEDGRLGTTELRLSRPVLRDCLVRGNEGAGWLVSATNGCSSTKVRRSDVT
jgi:hypothetical protein